MTTGRKASIALGAYFFEAHVLPKAANVQAGKGSSKVVNFSIDSLSSLVDIFGVKAVRFPFKSEDRAIVAPRMILKYTEAGRSKEEAVMPLFESREGCTVIYRYDHHVDVKGEQMEVPNGCLKDLVGFSGVYRRGCQKLTLAVFCWCWNSFGVIQFPVAPVKMRGDCNLVQGVEGLGQEQEVLELEEMIDD